MTEEKRPGKNAPEIPLPEPPEAETPGPIDRREPEMPPPPKGPQVESPGYVEPEPEAPKSPNTPGR